MVRVRIFNVKYSPNLGDGLLAESLEQALTEVGSHLSVKPTVDLAGRKHYQSGRKSRKHLLNLLNRLSPYSKELLLRAPLKLARHKKWLPHYESHLTDVDAIVIGGGNLLIDADLNFPTKLSSLITAASKKKIPIYFYGIGVGGKWSQRGLTLIRAALKKADVRYVAVRDIPSKINFESFFSGYVNVEPTIVRDPGVLAPCYLLDSSMKIMQREKVVGLCVTSPIVISHHAELKVSQKYLISWYCRLYQLLVEDGYQIRFFTNGSPEDIDTAVAVIKNIHQNIPSSSILLRPNNPSELLAYISSCSVVVAFRMHAIIGAYATGVHPIALKWDTKLESFMHSIGKSHLLFSMLEDDINTVKAAIDDCVIDENAIQLIKDEAFEQVIQLAKRITI